MKFNINTTSLQHRADVDKSKKNVIGYIIQVTSLGDLNTSNQSLSQRN